MANSIHGCVREFGVVKLSRDEALPPRAEGSSTRRFLRTPLEWSGALTLFAATAAVVIWQDMHLAVLWDLSYILENAHRISLGEVPYRDFPFPYAPLTFLIQAALIKMFGRIFWHTTVYCAFVNGMASVVAWRVIRNVLRETLLNFRLLSLVLAVPLIPLGIYS